MPQIIVLIFLSFFNSSYSFEVKDPYIERIFEKLDKLDIRYIYSDGKIITADEVKNPSIKIYGRQEALESLEITYQNDTLTLQYDSAVENDNNLKVYVELRIPNTTDLSMSVIDGDWSMDKLLGDVTLQSYGDGFFIFDEIVADDVTLTLNGSGNVDIHKGEIGMLNAKLVGSGRVSYSGEAESASFEIIGSGQINVHQVLKEIINQAVFGSGRVKIKNYPLPPNKINKNLKNQLEQDAENLKQNINASKQETLERDTEIIAHQH